MTPAIWNKIASHIEEKEKALVVTGTIALAIFLIIIIGIITQLIEPTFLMIPPIAVVMFCGGLGLVRYQFKTLIENKYSSFAEYQSNSSFIYKFIMWYGAIFMALWLCGIVVILFAAIIIGFQAHMQSL